MRRHQRGEGMVAYIIVLTLIALVCISAAAFLGNEIIALIIGTGSKNVQVENKVDSIKIDGAGKLDSDGDGEPDDEDSAPTDPNEG